MKNYLCLLLLVYSIFFNAQVAVGVSVTDHKGKIENKNLEQFLDSETIFVFPPVYDKSVYEKILKDVWTITPYKVFINGEVDFRDYMSDKYSFAVVDGKIVEKNISTSVYTYFSFFTFDMKEKTKEIEKVLGKSKKKNDYDLFEKHRQYVGGFYLFQKGELVQSSYANSIKETSRLAQSEDIFFNFKPGLLKNYLQAVQEGINDKAASSVYDVFNTPDLKKLQTATLYIPNYIGVKFNPNLRKLEDKERSEEDKEELFSKYGFKYEFIDDNALSDKILNNEDIYYFRYVRMNNGKFLNIVEAKTGKIIYSESIFGMSYNLKPDYIKDMSNAIKKL
jgi:hypothetical protein